MSSEPLRHLCILLVVSRISIANLMFRTLNNSFRTKLVPRKEECSAGMASSVLGSARSDSD